MPYDPRPIQLELGEGFSDVVRAASFPELTLRFRNQRAAETVGLGALDDAGWERHFARFDPLPDNLPEALALRYHGHQFQAYNPQLGDGRGFLFAQLAEERTGRILDLATKGSGQTPYSRTADGRLTLKGGVREILASEMLEARGVPTCRTFSLYETGEALYRSDEPSPTRASVLVRLSHSHIRFGSFQRHAHRGDHAQVALLVEHAVEHHLPEARGHADLASAFLRAVRDRSADLAAAWMVAGFVHGVLNTDNMVVTGESFDYGPWRFLPRLDPSFTAAYFDDAGLYAYGRQPRAVLWNLLRLAEAVRGMLVTANGRELVEPIMREFEPRYRERLVARWLARLGVRSSGVDEDTMLVEACMAWLEKEPVGFDAFFHDWFGGGESHERAMRGPWAARYADPSFAHVRRSLDACAPRSRSLLEHPALQRATPCSMLIDEVEAIWARIAHADDWSALDEKVHEVRAAAALQSADTTGS